MALVDMNMEKSKQITGKTVLVWLVCFFGVIFAANGIFLYLALGSFPGVAVESSYEAGQAYNNEIAAAKAQAALNWNVSSELLRSGSETGQLKVIAKDAEGTPLYGVIVNAVLKHPAQENADIDIILISDGGGRYLGTIEKLPAGNWDLIVEISQNSERRFKSENRVFISE